jgi:DNA-directed RNA polymerase specialized sigma24 family protein
MPEYSNTQSALEIEELILSCKPYIERLARKYAASAGSVLLEFDDYVSFGMIGIYEAASHLERCTTNVPAYLCGAANRAMVQEYCTSRCISVSDALSLDAPLGPDGSFSLADTLADSPSLPAKGNKRVCAVWGALKRLKSAKQRDALQRLYGLEGCGRLGSGVAREMGIIKSTLDSRRHLGLVTLRKDALLCEAVGVEVTQ